MPMRERPPCRPTTMASMPCRWSSSSRVCAYRASSPPRRGRLRAGGRGWAWKTRTCAGAEMSIQTLKRAPAPHSSPRWSILNVPLVPEREGEQAPQLPACVLPAGDVSPRMRWTAPGSKNPLPAECLGRQVSRANGSSSPRSHAAAGIEKLRLRRRRSGVGTRGPRPYAAAPSCSPAPRARSGARARSSSRRGRGTGLAPRGSAPSRLGRSLPAGRRRGRSRDRHPVGGRGARRLRSRKRFRSRLTGSKALCRPVSSARASAEKISFHAW